MTPPFTPTYYVPSNRVGARLLWVFPIVGGAFAAASGMAYALVSLLIVQVFEARWAFIIATPMFGALLALAGRGVSYLGHVRRASWRLPIELAVGVLGIYASWQFYVSLLGAKPAWIMSPAMLGHAMAALVAEQEIGFWLPVAWVLEAAVALGMIVFLHSTDDEPPTPFCEKCDSWTGEALALEFAASADEPAAEHLKRGEATALAKLPRRETGDSPYAVVRAYHCPCRASRYVSVHRARVERGKDASVGFRRYSARDSGSLTFDPGDPDETHFTPVLLNLAIDAEMEEALVALKR